MEICMERLAALYNEIKNLHSIDPSTSKSKMQLWWKAYFSE